MYHGGYGREYRLNVRRPKITNGRRELGPLGLYPLNARRELVNDPLPAVTQRLGERGPHLLTGLGLCKEIHQPGHQGRHGHDNKHNGVNRHNGVKRRLYTGGNLGYRLPRLNGTGPQRPRANGPGYGRRQWSKPRLVTLYPIPERLKRRDYVILYNVPNSHERVTGQVQYRPLKGVKTRRQGTANGLGQLVRGPRKPGHGVTGRPKALKETRYLSLVKVLERSTKQRHGGLGLFSRVGNLKESLDNLVKGVLGTLTPGQ